MVTINQILQDGARSLEGKSQTPLLDAQVLLAHTLGVERIYLIVNKDRILNKEEWEKYNGLLGERLQGVPVQYLVKNQEFMGLDFYVEEGVLIPRPDTEILVEKIISMIDQSKSYNIADIGTGSGAITVSLGRFIKNSYIYSIDISEKALTIGKRNAENHGVASKISFLKGSIYQPLQDLKLENKLDIIVSNPPYIPTKDIEGLQVEVSKYEPKEALDGGADGLDFYRKIINEAHRYLKPGGLIALEVGHDQAEKIAELLNAKKCYTNIETTKDLAGIDRVVSARYY